MAERHQRIEKLFIVLLTGIVLLVAPARAWGAATEEALEGTLVTRHGDDLVAMRTHDRSLWLETGHKYLRLVGDMPERLLGSRIRVRGTRTAMGFAVEPGSVEPLGASFHASETGQKKVAVILFNFVNAPVQPYTPAFAEGVIFSNPDSVANHLAEESWGKLTMAGKIYGWYTIQRQTTGTCLDGELGAVDAEKAAAADGFRWADFTNVIYAFPWQSKCGWGGLAYQPGGISYNNGAMSLSIVAHELHHNYGLPHSSSYACTSAGVPVPYSTSCTQNEYGDPFDLMGHGWGRHTHNKNAFTLGWFPAADVKTVVAPGEYVLAPSQVQTSAPKALRVQRPWSSEYLYLEFRQPYGSYFDNFAADDPAVNGVSVRLVNVGDFWFTPNSRLLDMTPETQNVADQPLAVDKSFSIANMKITTTEVGPSGAKVKIEALLDTVAPGQVTGNTWFLANDLGSGAHPSFSFGKTTDRPVVGDWDGDGTTTPGVVRGNVWYLIDGFGSGTLHTFAFGKASDRIVVGDWDGDGTTTPGVVRGNVWYLIDGFGSGALHTFSYGKATDRPIVGDWNADGNETPGIIRGNLWAIANQFGASADYLFDFGTPDEDFVVGDWD